VTSRTLLARALATVVAQEDINFLLTNRLPRRWLTLFMGWFSRIELPPIRWVSLKLWALFADVDLRDSLQPRFRSLHDAFTRELKPGTRPVDSDPRRLCSPCDAIVGSCGALRDGQLLQAKGMSYALDDLLGDEALAARYRNGHYVTLRLTAGMYHRFHAPADCRVEQANYISGDTWNVNPIALRRVERLFCRNERVVLRLRLARSGHLLTLVPVAAILVASVRLHFVDVRLHLRYRGPNVIPCDARLAKGEEMGWFEHGSTIIVFAPQGYALEPGVVEGATIRMGQGLMSG
jgi:phosphatidylserine decarboxylase